MICPGGGFRDVWIDREGHDLAIWLKDHNVTSLVLKYRTRPAEIGSREAWRNYQGAVQADGKQAIRILRKNADDLGLDPNKIGICGFSAGGHLAISCTLHGEPKTVEPKVSGMPDFTGLFYPGIPDGAGRMIESRSAPASATRPIKPSSASIWRMSMTFRPFLSPGLGMRPTAVARAGTRSLALISP